MKATKSIFFWVGVILAALAFLMTVAGFGFLISAVWWALIGFAVLLIGVLLKKV